MKICFLFLMLFAGATQAQKNYAKLLNDYAQAANTINEFNGTILVMQKGKPVYEKAFGLADREWNIANTINTKYRIGSVTKQFTAACILKLAEKGLLSLEDKLAKYFPDYPKGDSINIHMLLSHTSGIANYTDLAVFWPKAILPLSQSEMIALFKDAPFDFSPGSKWNYSNSGYYLLGVIIEKVSGEQFSDYLHDNFLKPAGMTNSGIDRLDSILAYRADGYIKSRNGGWQHADLISMEGPFSAGAMYATVEDLYKWNLALHSKKILTEASLKKMLTPYMQSYGYGIFIDSLQSHRRISHSGGIPGFDSYLAWFPAEEISISVISNNEANSQQVGEKLSAILFDIPVKLPYKPVEVKINPSILDNYTGKYEVSGIIEIIKKDNKLYRHKEGAPDIELKPESTTRFFYADNSYRFIEFEIDNSGKVEKAWFIVNDQKMPMARR